MQWIETATTKFIRSDEVGVLIAKLYLILLFSVVDSLPVQSYKRQKKHRFVNGIIVG
jgi:hypothetical protein